VTDREEMKQMARDVVAQVARHRIRDDEALVSSGLIDSLSVLRLISQLEHKLQIQIPKEQVQPEDFDSVDLIMETIERVTP
jgi:acyl carrier protein